jgi:site-specific DNA recombinase
MTPTHAIKKGVRYRYYVSRRLITNVRSGDDRNPGAGQRLPAAELERMVIARLKIFFADADAIATALPADRRSAPVVKRALAAAAGIVRAIVTEGEERTLGLLRPLIVRAQVHFDRVDVDLGADRLADALLGGDGSVAARLGPRQDDDRDGDVASSTAVGDPVIRLTIEAELKRVGMEMKFVLEGAAGNSSVDTAFVRLLIRAQSLARRLAMSPNSTLEEAGAQEGMGAPYAARLMRLNFLAPEIVVAILKGRQPVALTASKLMADTRLPLEWIEQLKALGFA